MRLIHLREMYSFVTHDYLHSKRGNNTQTIPATITPDESPHGKRLHPPSSTTSSSSTSSASSTSSSSSTSSAPSSASSTISLSCPSTPTTIVGHHQQLSRVPALPPIEVSSHQSRVSPLTIEEYESMFRLNATNLELVDRIFAGSMANNQLRAGLWPYLFGLVPFRGRFEKIGADTYTYIDHEENEPHWWKLKKLFQTYQGQWKAITSDQELRFSTFRDRKSLIERDVIRCDRLHPFYAQEPENLSKLTNLLMTYMMYDFDIGYVQGMSDIAGPILYMFEADLVKSFWVFVEVMKLFRRNFEPTQKTIHFQLNFLFELIKNTDPVFAQYLEDNETSNCFFAFRAIVCQFKRELMKEDEDDYSNVLLLWDTIWCAARRCAILEEAQQSNCDTGKHSGSNSPNCEFRGTHAEQHHNHHFHYYNHQNSSNQQPTLLTTPDNRFVSSIDSNQSDSPKHKLTESELFILALCLSLIRRERHEILANRLDSTDIHLHFIDPKLASDINSFIENAVNIYWFLKHDFDLNKLYSPKSQAAQTPYHSVSSEINPGTSPGDVYDSLSDFLIINGVHGT